MVVKKYGRSMSVSFAEDAIIEAFMKKSGLRFTDLCKMALNEFMNKHKPEEFNR